MTVPSFSTRTLSLLAGRMHLERNRTVALRTRLRDDIERNDDTDLSDVLDDQSPMAGSGEVDRLHTRALLVMTTDSLRDLDAALGRIDIGTYGQCATCGQAISLARLRAIPAATRCVGCQRLVAEALAFAG